MLTFSSYLTDLELTQGWLNGYWPTVPVSLNVLYLLLIYVLKKWMDGRKPTKLKLPLLAWNAILAAFSIVAFLQFAPTGLLNELANGGFVHSVCLITPLSTPKLNFWSTLFVLSKFVEFGDTFFLVFKKSPLTFLHIYHHVTVSMLTWFGATTNSSVGNWFCAMNYGVHSIMYTYFTIRTLGVKLPSVVAKTITSLQLCQFSMGLVCIVLAAVRLSLGMKCNTTVMCASASLVVYGSYLVLFLNFFYRRYARPEQQKKD